MTDAPRPPLPPFTEETARTKVRAAEDAWNGRDPARIALAYTADSVWRNRSEFFAGRAAIEGFLARKWVRELDYRLIKELWACDGDVTAIGSPFASPTNGATTRATGSAPTATRTGSSTSAG